MDLAADLHAKGRRLTLQRRLVLDAVQKARHHVTAEEVARRVREAHPQVDPSTVYRNLETLEELGYVTHTHLGGRVTRWHRADTHQHGHLVCRSCGTEDEVPIAAFEPLARRLRNEHGFRADVAHSAIEGICRRCATVQS